MNNTNSSDRIDALKLREREDLAAALLMAAQGQNLYQIAIKLGRSKEWLRARGIN